MDGRADGTADDAPVIPGSEPDSFAHGVLTRRHPALIAQVREALPYPPARLRALDALLDEITGGVVEPLPRDAQDHGQWLRWGRGHLGRPWTDAPFLWAESYFYRRLLDATGYFAPGPWRGVDPFGPFKAAELRDLRTGGAGPGRPSDAPADASPRERALLTAALWGNRADLGFRVGSGGDAAAAGLVADDSDRLWALLPPGGRAAVHLVADNAGPELVPDLLLIDHLLAAGRAERVTLHVKPYPYYVSDATMTDVLDALGHLRAAEGPAARAGTRLRSALSAGRLAVGAHPFFTAPFPYTRMPDDLRAELADGTLTILKGDLNYRRLVGDRYWPPTTPFDGAAGYFPTPVAALRTLKSDVITGLAPRTVASLDATAPAWRTSGTHALIQVHA